MRRVVLLLSLVSATCVAQVMVEERRIGRILPAFADPAPAATLHCSVTPVRPQLNYGFRFQAGYVVTVAMDQFEGAGHRWRMIARITPEQEGGRPVYLVSYYRLPAVPSSRAQLHVGGVYLLGEGAYKVRFLFLDEAGRTCRHDWRVNVHRSRGEAKVRMAMPPGSVMDLSLRRAGAAPAAAPADDAHPIRLSILLHAAPAFPRRTRLRPTDILMLLSSVSALLEHVPATSVRLVAFNLDQQKELYRKESFGLTDLPELSAAVMRTELGLVDVKVLANRRGHVDTIAGLVQGELAAQPAPDAVVFLGPVSRYTDKPPAAAPETPGSHPRFLFFRLAPFGTAAVRRGGVIYVPEATLPDSIGYAVSRMGGKTITIHNPGDLAKAIDRLEQTSHRGG
jgi:hypothetical protein